MILYECLKTTLLIRHEYNDGKYMCYSNTNNILAFFGNAVVLENNLCFHMIPMILIGYADFNQQRGLKKVPLCS